MAADNDERMWLIFVSQIQLISYFSTSYATHTHTHELEIHFQFVDTQQGINKQAKMNTNK